MNQEPIIIEKVYKAPINKVWSAITEPEQMKKWYFDLPNFKAEVGCEFTFEGGPPERSYLHLCKVTEVIIGRKISYTWRYEGYEGDSLVTFELFDLGNETKIILSHAGLHTFPASNPDLDKKNFVEGWTDLILNLLTTFVEGES